MSGCNGGCNVNNGNACTINNYYEDEDNAYAYPSNRFDKSLRYDLSLVAHFIKEKDKTKPEIAP